ncbi:MAG: hypothetical protein UZ05_CHB002000821 [Chlorobi bacterium OLB5]|nr:MAG: hypothetical protein UZ05_CHB002000821 [Chlorobi bacterium OLB5]
MAHIIKGRKFANVQGDFVVFLIGMRVNNFWKIHKWLPVAMAMPGMIKELYKNPEYGFLGERSWFGRISISVQYWRSFEHLEAYAKNKDLEHFPAWKAFNQKARQSGVVGVWHETYKVSAGSYENIYVNMPIFGLGKASEYSKTGAINEADGIHEYASGRLNK